MSCELWWCLVTAEEPCFLLLVNVEIWDQALHKNSKKWQANYNSQYPYSHIMNLHVLWEKKII